MSRRSSRRPLSRGEKWLYFSCPLLVLLVAGVARFYALRDATPAIAFPAQRPLPNPNGFDLYLQSALTITNSNPTVDPIDDFSPPSTASGRAARYSLARRRAWLDRNEVGFAMFQHALKTPCAFPQKRGKSSSPVPFVRFSQLAEKQVKRANTYKLEGRWGDAAQAGLDAIQMGSDIGRGGDLLTKLRTSPTMFIGYKCLVGFDDVPGHLNAKEARAAAKRLEQIMAGITTFAQALETDRWDTLALFLDAIKNPDWRRGGDEDKLEKQPRWEQLVNSRVISKTEIVQRINAKFDAMILDVKRPYSAPFDESLNNLDLLSRQFGFYNPLTRKIQVRDDTRLRLLLLRFALQAYRAEHGMYPTSLSALSPAYLKHVPTDSYADGKPLRYIAQGQKYQLWSVGPDGKDDRGKAIVATKKPPRDQPPSPVVVLPDSKGDWVVGKNR